MAGDFSISLALALRNPPAPSSDYDLNPELRLAPSRKLRAAAVLVAIDVSDPISRLWLTKRSSALEHHPGQVAFPGGKQDEGDADLAQTALREAQEEIGLAPESVEVLGALSPHETVTGFLVTPIVGLIRKPFTPVPEAGEVSEVFAVPVSHVFDTDRFTIQSRRWRGQRRKYYTIPYGPYYIWGATARMLYALADATEKEADAA
ncbi:MAG: CoA pyrophosphatase [Pseudomonadota bacterium]